MKAPKAPDPKATAQAQGQMNKETAVTQAGLNMTNQVGPNGSISYRQIGTWPDGTPRYEATTTLSPEQQRLQELENRTAANLGQVGVEQSGRIGQLLNRPVDLNNEATEARLMELGRKRLDPRFATEKDQLMTQLINRGIRPGTPAYNDEMKQFSEGRNDAYNQLLLQGRGQAVQEALTQRNQPLNEISALMSGSQVSMPNFIGTPQTPVSGVDYAGLVADKYKSDMAGYSAGMGGLFGLGGTAASALLPMISDRRVKEDVEEIGRAHNGLPIYLYRLKGSATPQIGFMADEVAQVRPEAVVRMRGVDHVRYDLAVR